MGNFKITGTSFFWLKSWTLANIIQLATIDFCKHFLNQKNDPCGRLYDQMTQAARSAQANITEGTARHSTSRETEMKLTDVARGSIAELSMDYQQWIMQAGKLPWSTHSAEYDALKAISLAQPTFKDDVYHNSAQHIFNEKKKFDAWLTHPDNIVQANCLLYLCWLLEKILMHQTNDQLEQFKEQGGFTETLTAERLEARSQQSIEDNAPLCPICGKPMIVRMAKKGINSGRPFWGCSDYPNCTGTLPHEEPATK